MFKKICLCISVIMMNCMYANDIIDDLTADLLKVLHEISQKANKENKKKSRRKIRSNRRDQNKSVNQKIITKSEIPKKYPAPVFINRTLTYQELTENFEDFKNNPEKLKSFMVNHAVLLEESALQIQEWKQAADMGKLKLKCIGSCIVSAGSVIVSALPWVFSNYIEEKSIKSFLSILSAGVAVVFAKNAKNCHNEMNDKKILLERRKHHEEIHDWLLHQQKP